MLFTAVCGLIPPVEAEAAYAPSSSVGKGTMSLDEIKAYINDEYLTYNFSTAEEMLETELAKGYLDYTTSADGMYSIYVNRYTGFLFYRNNYTGQILTSNPVNPGYSKLSNVQEIMSQITIKLTNAATSSSIAAMNSTQWSALYGQISVAAMHNGLRVSYTIGDTSTRFLLPGLITAEDFTSDILTPLLEAVEDTFADYDPENAIVFFDNPKYDKREENGGLLTTSMIRAYLQSVTLGTNSKPVLEVVTALQNILVRYSLKDPAAYADDPTMLEQMYKDYPITADGIAVYAYNMTVSTANKRNDSNNIKKYCPDYTIDMMYADEKECGYEHDSEQKPVFRCSLEYTFNEDGSLSIRLPANSISFDESAYTLEYITPLTYFGYGDMSDDGFIFFPDGSGTVVEFNDFYNVENGRKENLSLKAEIFGDDYCYSTITGAHREQITMPVYGLVTTLNTNKTTANTMSYLGNNAGDKVKAGYFAIIEEGASLAELQFSSGGTANIYGSVYASYSPYPSDTYDLSETLSVGQSTQYTIVSESKYTGSYVTRIQMLIEDSVGAALYGAGGYYNTTYTGMANYYRQYLKNDGTLGALENVSTELPLYIETLGSMNIIEKILTFPIETSIPLTTFDDVITMYNQLANAKEHVQSLIDENLAKAEEEKEKENSDELLVEEYLNAAESYRDLLTKINDIKNINFRLTGFANDGMYYTYPTKVKWERACGGEDGFESLVSKSNEINKAGATTFGVYPEFDFMYINNTTLFDGISERDTVSRMVDNRYAAKQVYNAVLQEYESFFTMVISSDALDGLYSEFLEDYSEYDVPSISVSTLGSDVNSNFDEDNPINRDDSRTNIMALLDRMANEDGYDLMLDKGNIYTVKYATHILNVATDSSHYRYSSYTVPFVGMILHGHVNYAGTPINYSGSVDYEILRSIENGAAPYYILCYQNTQHLKEDEELNEYYGVDYKTWYSDLLLTYNELNTQIGGLQEYEIVDHYTVIAEREREESEKQDNYNNIEAEYLMLLENEMKAKLDATFDQLKAEQKYDERVKILIDAATITEQFKSIVADGDLTFNSESFSVALGALIDEYTTEYSGSSDESLNVNVEIDGVENYVSEYNYHTDSDARDEDYVYTDYTLDNGKVVIVTYKHPTTGDEVRFILNFNIYTVNVNIDGEIITLDKYEYEPIKG